MSKQEKLAREMFMWSDGVTIEQWHKASDVTRNYWRCLANLAINVLGRVNA